MEIMGKMMASQPPDPRATQREGSDFWFHVGITGALLAVFGVAIGGPFLWVQHEDRVEATMEAAAQFQTGEIVRSRIANFRGVVMDVRCNKSCIYEVRFNAASMEPQWMEANELEAEK